MIEKTEAEFLAINAVVTSARKYAARTKDEAMAIVINGLCSLIEQQQEDQELREAVFLYIEAKKKLTLCMQDHFRQVCHSCKNYAKCGIYAGYVETWMNLQECYKAGKEVEKE